VDMMDGHEVRVFKPFYASSLTELFLNRLAKVVRAFRMRDLHSSSLHLVVTLPLTVTCLSLFGFVTTRTSNLCLLNTN